jgi:2-polyprenyl-3-methyl-5-hydroxy-6-metoxy-1,4-benzoquinol methylase
VHRDLDAIKSQGGLDEVIHALPDELYRLARRPLDLVIVVDDGFDYPLPKGVGPVAYWAIDTHLNFERSLWRSRQADYVFAAQKLGAQRLRESGIPTATWVPLGCDPQMHGKQHVPKQFNVAFVGNALPGRRTTLLRRIDERFRPVFIGNGVYFQQMAAGYSAAWIVFNCCINFDLNMRVFEGLASGSLVFTNALPGNGQDELFTDGKHLATYGTDDDEAMEKLAYYLDDKEACERIGAAGRAEVLAKHTYAHRVHEILALVAAHRAGAELGSGSKASSAPAGWAKRSPGPPDANDVSAIPDRSSVISHPSPITHHSPLTIHQGAATHHDASYFDHARPELLPLVSDGAKTILDVGCGSGRFGESLKARQPCEVVGIELDQRAAALAHARLDKVFCCDVASLDAGPWHGHFDTVVLADVLEHFLEPAAQLLRLRACLKVGGQVVLSVPNVREHRIVRGLLLGNFTYEPAGITDHTHQSFYTLDSLKRFLAECGFVVEQVHAVPTIGFDEWERAGRPGNISIAGMHLAGPPEDVFEYFVYQWLVVATTPAKPAAPRRDLDLNGKLAA